MHSCDNFAGWPVWNWTAAAGVAIGYLIGWLTFRCRHDWFRREDRDHLFDVGRNKLFYWQCRRCGKFKTKCAW